MDLYFLKEYLCVSERDERLEFELGSTTSHSEPLSIAAPAHPHVHDYH